MRLAIVFAKFCSDVISTGCWTEAYAFVSQTGCLCGEAEGKVFFILQSWSFPFAQYALEGDRVPSVKRNAAFPKPLQLFKLFAYSSERCFEALMWN